LFADLTQASIIKILYFVASLGAAWMMLKQLRKDLNGLGKKVRDQRSVDEQRFLASTLMLIVNCEDKQERRWLAERILDANRGSHGS